MRANGLGHVVVLLVSCASFAACSASSPSEAGGAEARGNGGSTDGGPDGSSRQLGIASISPRTAPTTGGVTVTIDGDEFEEGLVVTIDGVQAHVESVSPTRVVVIAPPRPGRVGKVDLAIVNPDQKTVTAKEGFGYYFATTAFVEQEKRPVSYKPFSIASGDFDKDGNRDLAVANDNGQSVSILLGKGDGTFPFPAGANKFPELPVGNLSICVVVNDLDGDGNEDLVVTNFQGQRSPPPLEIAGDVSVLMGKGDGTFSPETIYFTGLGPSTVVVEDFDKDGIKDLAVLNAESDTVSVLRGLGNGKFQQYSQQLRFPSGANPRYLALADFNRDGLPDLAVAGLGGSVSVLAGRSGSLFSTDKPGSYGAGAGTYFVVTGDLDGDGVVDIVTADRGFDQSVPGSITALLGRKDGTFPEKGQAFAAGKDPRSVALGDLNGDGFLDVVVTNYADDTVGVLIGTGDGRFLPSLDLHIAAVPGGGANGPCSVVIDDLNEDGKKDLAVTNCYGNTVSILLNDSR